MKKWLTHVLNEFPLEELRACASYFSLIAHTTGLPDEVTNLREEGTKQP